MIYKDWSKKKKQREGNGSYWFSFSWFNHGALPCWAWFNCVFVWNTDLEYLVISDYDESPGGPCWGGGCIYFLADISYIYFKWTVTHMAMMVPWKSFKSSTCNGSKLRNWTMGHAYWISLDLALDPAPQMQPHLRPYMWRLENNMQKKKERFGRVTGCPHPCGPHGQWKPQPLDLEQDFSAA